MKYLLAVLAFVSFSAMAGERISIGMVCVTERAVMSLVEAEMNGGVDEVKKALLPLLTTNQCRLAPHGAYIVTLKIMLMKYKSAGGFAEVWETKRGLFIIALNNDGSA